MTKPPRNWQAEAEAKQSEIWEEKQRLTVLHQKIRIARREDDFEAYYEALMEWGVEVSEP